MKYNDLTFTQKLIGNLIGFAIISPLVAWNYWGGLVALFSNHPSYLQVWAATTIFLIPSLFKILKNSANIGKSLLARVLQLATLIAFFSWVLRLVGIMPNAPF